MLGVAGYMMKAGHFSKSHESSGDLNRRSQDGVPRAFWLLFARRKKWQSALPCRERFEVLQTSNQHTKLQLRTNPIKSFCRSAAFAPPCGDFFFLLFVSTKSRAKNFETFLSPWNMVALLTSVRNSPCFGGLRRTKTCHRQLFARPSSIFFLLFVKYKK